MDRLLLQYLACEDVTAASDVMTHCPWPIGRLVPRRRAPDPRGERWSSPSSDGRALGRSAQTA